MQKLVTNFSISRDRWKAVPKRVIAS